MKGVMGRLEDGSAGVGHLTRQGFELIGRDEAVSLAAEGQPRYAELCHLIRHRMLHQGAHAAEGKLASEITQIALRPFCDFMSVRNPQDFYVILNGVPFDRWVFGKAVPRKIQSEAAEAGLQPFDGFQPYPAGGGPAVDHDDRGSLWWAAFSIADPQSE